MTGPRFRAAGEEIVANLPSQERTLLSEVLDLLAWVPRDGDDPASQRLRVPVYLNDREANQEWWRLMGEELTAARNADRRVYRRVMESEAETTLSVSEANALLRVLNEGRLALGARFGLEVEEDHDRLPEAQRQILDYLGWVLEELTAELTRSL